MSINLQQIHLKDLTNFVKNTWGILYPYVSSGVGLVLVLFVVGYVLVKAKNPFSILTLCFGIYVYSTFGIPGWSYVKDGVSWCANKASSLSSFLEKAKKELKNKKKPAPKLQNTNPKNRIETKPTKEEKLPDFLTKKPKETKLSFHFLDEDSVVPTKKKSKNSISVTEEKSPTKPPKLKKSWKKHKHLSKKTKPNKRIPQKTPLPQVNKKNPPIKNLLQQPKKKKKNPSLKPKPKKKTKPKKRKKKGTTKHKKGEYHSFLPTFEEIYTGGQAKQKHENQEEKEQGNRLSWALKKFLRFLWENKLVIVVLCIAWSVYRWLFPNRNYSFREEGGKGGKFKYGVKPKHKSLDPYSMGVPPNTQTKIPPFPQTEQGEESREKTPPPSLMPDFVHEGLEIQKNHLTLESDEASDDEERQDPDLRKETVPEPGRYQGIPAQKGLSTAFYAAWHASFLGVPPDQEGSFVARLNKLELLVNQGKMPEQAIDIFNTRKGKILLPGERYDLFDKSVESVNDILLRIDEEARLRVRMANRKARILEKYQDIKKQQDELIQAMLGRKRQRKEEKENKETSEDIDLFLARAEENKKKAQQEREKQEEELRIDEEERRRRKDEADKRREEFLSRRKQNEEDKRRRDDRRDSGIINRIEQEKDQLQTELTSFLANQTSEQSQEDSDNDSDDEVVQDMENEIDQASQDALEKLEETERITKEAQDMQENKPEDDPLRSLEQEDDEKSDELIEDMKKKEDPLRLALENLEQSINEPMPPIDLGDQPTIYPIDLNITIPEPWTLEKEQDSTELASLKKEMEEMEKERKRLGLAASYETQERRRLRGLTDDQLAKEMWWSFGVQEERDRRQKEREKKRLERKQRQEERERVRERLREESETLKKESERLRRQSKKPKKTQKIIPINQSDVSSPPTTFQNKKKNKKPYNLVNNKKSKVSKIVVHRVKKPVVRLTTVKKKKRCTRPRPRKEGEDKVKREKERKRLGLAASYETQERRRLRGLTDDQLAKEMWWSFGVQEERERRKRERRRLRGLRWRQLSKEKGLLAQEERERREIREEQRRKDEEQRRERERERQRREISRLRGLPDNQLQNDPSWLAEDERIRRRERQRRIRERERRTENSGRNEDSSQFSGTQEDRTSIQSGETGGTRYNPRSTDPRVKQSGRDGLRGNNEFNVPNIGGSLGAFVKSETGKVSKELAEQEAKKSKNYFKAQRNIASAHYLLENTPKTITKVSKKYVLVDRSVKESTQWISSGLGNYNPTKNILSSSTKPPITDLLAPKNPIFDVGLEAVSVKKTVPNTQELARAKTILKTSRKTASSVLKRETSRSLQRQARNQLIKSGLKNATKGVLVSAGSEIVVGSTINVVKNLCSKEFHNLSAQEQDEVMWKAVKEPLPTLEETPKFLAKSATNYAGAQAGAAVGTLIFPGIGTFLGAVAGGLGADKLFTSLFSE